MIWIQTFLGKQFFPLKPKVEDICIEDVAHSLSMICRFNGHCIHFYSVAQHSVLVAQEIKNTKVWRDGYKERRIMILRAALLHDAAEAYLGDVCRPTKALFKEYIEHEIALQKLIHYKFFVTMDTDIREAIKQCDDILLATEARDLMRPSPVPWDKLPLAQKKPIHPLLPNDAETLFLDQWNLVKP